MSERTVARRVRCPLAALACSILVGHATLAGGVAIVRTELLDDGDHDGFADTNETVELRLVLRNTLSTDLHDLVLRLSTDSPEVACIGRSLIVIGDLAAGEERGTPSGFVFTVGAVDRQSLGLGELADLSITLGVELSSDERVGTTVPAKLQLDLDLEVSGGTGPTTFFESFESGTFGAFEDHNMDAGLHSLQASDGYRCQYHDPDLAWDPVPYCFLGESQAQADAFFWQIQTPEANNGGKAFSGNNSLYMGVFGPTADYQTTPSGVLESVRLTNPINLGHQGVSLELSLKQQVDFMDSRHVNSPAGEGPDRGIVGLQLADASGQPVGSWIKLEPYLNVYDTLGVDNYYNCTFDPVDDGNDEDDYFDPTDPDRRYGPSSTCKPELSFAYIGETSAPFDAASAGNADGPGLQGSLGVGTWIESRFHLDRFRGRRVRLRFLNTSLRVGVYGSSPPETWGQLFTSLNPGPGDDGWWIDDVSVTGALTGAATMSVDTAPNTSLPGRGDDDGDGRSNACDVCPFEGDPLQADADFDGVGDACDNCPGLTDPDRTDSDGDGLGDACDRCPVDDDGDGDLDGVPCAADNCPDAANAGQSDTDADGAGNSCDACPADPRNDVDGDGVCGDVDDCEVLYDPEQSGVMRLSGPLFAFGSVSWFAISPDDRTIVYAATLQKGGPPAGLFAARPGEDPAIRTIHALHDVDSVPFIVFSPDGSRIVYQTLDTPSRLYSARLDGTAPVELVELPFGFVEFAISPDGARVVYDRLRYGGDGHELYSIPIDGGAPSHLTPGVLPQDVAQLEISRDSTRVFHIADREQLAREELYVMPIVGGAPTKLNAPTGNLDVTRFELAPDGSVVVYQVGSTLYSVPASGGSSTLLFQQGGLDDFAITPESARVVVTLWDGGMYSVPIAGGSPVTLITEGVSLMALTPDGDRVVFTRWDATTLNLFSIPVGGGTPLQLNAPVTGAGVIRFTLSPDGSTVAYLADEHEYGVWELSSVPVTGGSPVLLNGPLVSGGTVHGAVFSHDGSKIAYFADQEADEVVELHVVAAAGGAPKKINGSLSPGGDVDVDDPPASPFFREDTAVVYRADQLVDEQREVFGADLDLGGTGDGGLCDCDADSSVFPGAPERNDGRDNQCPGDDGHGFADELDALFFPTPDKTLLCWDAQAGATLYQLARSSSPDFGTGCTPSSTALTCTTDATNPPPGSAAYFLARPLAPYPGSWGPGANGVERTISCP